MTIGGSPLYDVNPEHAAAVVALVLLAVGAWLFRARLPRLAALDALLLWLLLSSAAVHAGLAIGHVDASAGLRTLFLADAVALAVVARRVWRGAKPGRIGALVLAGSILAYWVAVIRGEPPDQLGLANKLSEILALAIVVRPSVPSRVRGVLGSAAIVTLVLGTATSTWIGAFRAAASEPGAVAGHHVHAGGVAAPGTWLPAVAAREPTAAESTAAEGLLIATRAAIARYADPSVAAKAGYHVDGMRGIDFHANNPTYEHDGRVLDPERPETLVYAVAPDGHPVLLGALFVMPDASTPGPTIGGPLTVWHAHEDICFSLLPLTLTGVLSPLGTCPIGSLTMPVTAEMMHVWTVPGAPTPFGDLDEGWKRAYLAANYPKR